MSLILKQVKNIEPRSEKNFFGTYLRNGETDRETEKRRNSETEKQRNGETDGNVLLHSCIAAAKKQDFFLPPRYSIFSGDHGLLVGHPKGRPLFLSLSVG